MRTNIKEIYLDLHSDACTARQDRELKGEVADYEVNYSCCDRTDKFLFFLGRRFYIMAVNRCLYSINDYDFKVFILNSIIKNNKIFSRWWNVQKSHELKKHLLEWRIRNVPLRNMIYQANYIYEDSTRKQYCIATKANYMETYYDQDVIDKSYNDMKDYLIKMKYVWLLEQLDLLYHVNKIWDIGEVETVKTVDNLIKLMKEEINT